MATVLAFSGNDLRIKVSDLEYHRNGVGGNGCVVARFSFAGERRKRIEAIGTIFSGPDDENPTAFTGYCAVVALDDAGRPDIHSTWCGDHFEGDLRKFIESPVGRHILFPHSYPRPMTA